MAHKTSIFILSAVLIHLIALTAASLFFGMPNTIILACLWAACWLGYCSYIQREQTEIYSQASYLKLVLIGGPLCWIFCPWAFWPAKHNAKSEPAAWILLLKIFSGLATSGLMLLRLLFDIAIDEEKTPDKETGNGQ